MMNGSEGKSRPGAFSSAISEIEAQEKDLLEYVSYLRSVNRPPADPAEVLFVGAGDSLAAAIFAERLMNFKQRSFDPFDLMLCPDVAKDKTVFLVSVSGRTRANIQAARKVREFAKETVAITANPDSELSKSCSSTIQIIFTKFPGLTPGTNSFTTSLMALCWIFNNLPNLLEVNNLLEQAKNWAKANSEIADYYHFVGSGCYYGIALYGAAKIFEFSGGRADYQLTEEFSHLNLFSMGKKDSVFLMGSGDSDLDHRVQELNSYLTEKGFRSTILPDFFGRNHPVERALCYSFCVQYLALEIALKLGLDESAFLRKHDLLEISNRMIY